MAVMRYREAMRKYASALGVVAAGQKVLSTAPGIVSAALIGAGLIGTGIGWATAHMTEHDDADIELAKKEYDNERIKADIGYLGGKLRAERNAMKNRISPKGARVLG